jgi:hypothetical protein
MPPPGNGMVASAHGVVNHRLWSPIYFALRNSQAPESDPEVSGRRCRFPILGRRCLELSEHSRRRFIGFASQNAKRTGEEACGSRRAGTMLATISEVPVEELIGKSNHPACTKGTSRSLQNLDKSRVRHCRTMEHGGALPVRISDSYFTVIVSNCAPLTT